VDDHDNNHDNTFNPQSKLLSQMLFSLTPGAYT